jgi:hypothetical protein
VALGYALRLVPCICIRADRNAAYSKCSDRLRPLGAVGAKKVRRCPLDGRLALAAHRVQESQQ